MATKMASESDKNINFVIEIIRERLEAIVPKPHPFPDRTTIQETVSTVLASLLCKESPDHYVRHVAELCKRLPSKGLWLERLRQCDAEEVYGAFHRLWEDLPGMPEEHLQPHLKYSFMEYIACKQNYGSAQKTYIETHVEVTRWLANRYLLPSQDPGVSDLITKLLALTYWLFRFNCEKKDNKKHRKTYNVHLHHFLSDLIVTFLLLKCLLPSSTLRRYRGRIPDFPKLESTIIHLGISPTDAVFQRLVLRQMFKLLQIECDENLKTPQDMAQSVQHFLSGYLSLGGEKGADGILRIVQDQSRYLTLRSPDLRRNFVADKTRREVSQAVKAMVESNIRAYLTIENQQQALKKFRSIMTGIDRSDDGSCLPPLPETLSEKDIKVINLLHHMIMFDVSSKFLDRHCPRINEEAWLILDNQKFTDFVEDLARRVLGWAKSIDTAMRTQLLYPHIAKLAVSLQQIIAARWYVSEVKMKGISGNVTVKQHQEVVFLFLGFRTLLLYLLPWNSYQYGVQSVAKNLPNYAKQIRLYLHLHVLG